MEKRLSQCEIGRRMTRYSYSLGEFAAYDWDGIEAAEKATIDKLDTQNLILCVLAHIAEQLSHKSFSEQVADAKLESEMMMRFRAELDKLQNLRGPAPGKIIPHFYYKYVHFKQDQWVRVQFAAFGDFPTGNVFCRPDDKAARAAWDKWVAAGRRKRIRAAKNTSTK